MLERYFMLPKTVDGIRRSWLADSIERYVAWLTERRFTASYALRRPHIERRLGAPKDAKVLHCGLGCQARQLAQLALVGL